MTGPPQQETFDLRSFDCAWNAMVGATMVRGGDGLAKAELIDAVLNRVPALVAHYRAALETLRRAQGYAEEIERSLYDHEGDAKMCAQHIQREATAALGQQVSA